MRKHILKNILAIITLFVPFAASAQCYVFHKNDVKIVFNYNEVDSVVLSVNNNPDPGPIEGKYVDLGLSVKWATCNLGADKPSDCGSYFSWGELETKDMFDQNNCSTTELDIDDIAGNPKYDAATNALGGKWRMPTREEFEELSTSCTWEWVEMNNRAGAKVTGPNGNSIFLPAAGYRIGGDVIEDHYKGYYWASTSYDIGISYCLEFKENCSMGGETMMFRDLGIVIRPVLAE